EVEGKEATLMLAREFALASDHPLLKDLDIILCPNYNADGNDRFDACEKNRLGQDGPALVGVRPNAMGLDLNRDYIKLEAPETREFIREILRFVAEHSQEVLDINRQAREETAAKGRHGGDEVGIRHKLAAFDKPVMVKGYEGTAGNGGEGGAAILKHDELGPP